MKHKIQLGQNFLINDLICERMSRYIDAKENLNLLEIGGGSGVLTKCLILLEYRQFHIIELDFDLIDKLEEK